jgi:hypothetical protein
LIRDEVAGAIAQMEGIRLRVNDVDFERRVIVSSLLARDGATKAQRMRGHFTNSLEAAT